MNFLALVIGLALQQLPGPREAVQRDHWFDHWWAWLAARALPAAARAAAAVLLPALLVVAALAVAGDWLFGLVGLAAAAALFLYALGRGDFSGLLSVLRTQAGAGDAEAMWLTALSALPGPALAGEATDAATALPRVREALLYEACQRWYAPLFFFVLAGPAAALAYRLLQLTAVREASARRALALADWVPARLLGLTFALTGDFAAASVAVDSAARPAPALLAACARRALGWSAEPRRVEAYAGELAKLEALLARSAGAWLLVLSLGYLLL